MSTRTPKLPGPDHPITIEPSTRHFVVKAGDTVIADTSQALLLREADYEPIPYLPLSAIDPELLQSSDTTTYCPYKGEASYYSIRTGDGVIEDALWFYDEPYEAVGEITGHAAFYPDKVQVSGD